MHRSNLVAATAVALAALAAAPAVAHQTATSRGVAVTMHVSPDDEPVAGRPSAVTVTKVRVPRGGKFRFSSCSCRLRVADSGGRIVADQRMRNRTNVTFPDAGAYRLTYSGSYKRGRSTRRFAVSFTLRAG